MEIRVTMLGTAGSSPARGRSLPGVAISYEGSVLLFDCGEGTQMQMLKYGTNYSRIEAIFITHAHGDHIIGMAGLVRTIAMNKRAEPLCIFVPKGYESIIKTLIAFDRAMIGYRIDVKGIGAGFVYRGKGFSVRAFRLRHTIAALGYVFREDERRNFVVDKCEKLGIKGEMYGILEKNGRIRVGKKTVRLNDVTTIKEGKKVVYASDSRPVSTTVAAARNADLLIHESSYADSEMELARERGHCTAGEAAAIAKKADAKKLVLTHISARYSSPGTIENDARKIFRNSEVAEDGEVIIV